MAFKRVTAIFLIFCMMLLLLVQNNTYSIYSEFMDLILNEDIKWGSNIWELLEDGTIIEKEIPLQVKDFEPEFNPRSRITGAWHTAVLKPDGTVWTWGNNEYGQLGDGTTTQRMTPAQALAITEIIDIAAKYDHTVALREDGTVWSWGKNEFGQLGDDSTVDRQNPAQVLGVTDIVNVDAGGEHTIALTEDGKVWTWGRNNRGQLGDGTTIQRRTPVEVEGLTNIVQVSAGVNHSVALKDDGTVWTWGRNEFGQLGDGTNTDSYVPIQINNLENIVSVKAGFAFTVVLKADGTVWTWGSNSNGRLGDGTTTARNIPAQALELTAVIQISSGRRHTVALKEDGTVWAWGRNDEGRVGDGTIEDKHVPTEVSGLTNIIEIEGGSEHSIALKKDGTIWTWGSNEYGQLGRTVTGDDNRIPVQVPDFNINRFTKSDFVCMLIDGEITIEEYVGTKTELEIPGIIAGYPVVTIDDEVFKDKGLTSIIIPEEVESIGSNALAGNELTEIFIGGANVSISDNLMGEDNDNFRQVYTDNVLGGAGRYVGTQDGEWEKTHKLLVVFRDDDNSIISTKTVNDGEIVGIPSEPIKIGYTFDKWVTELSGEEEWNFETPVTENMSLYASWNIVHLEGSDIHGKMLSGGFHTAIRKLDGTVWAWGRNEFGQLGDRTTIQRMTPEQVVGITDVIDVAAMFNHTVAIKEDRTVWTWGLNDWGRLGDGTTIQSNRPVKVLGLTDIVYADTGSFHTVALKNDRTVWTWGRNNYGQLGNGTYIDRYSPVQVVGLENVVDVSAGEDQTIALKADGTVWTWGRNHRGQLGDGTEIDSNIPVQVSNLENVVSVMAGHAFTAALKADGTVWAWGINDNGRLGDGTTTQRNIPVQVLELTNIVQISSGRRHTVALKDDGTVWAWGWNEDGQLGDGTTTDRYTPVQALGLTNITEVEGGRTHSVALKEDGTIWTWGGNEYEQLGRTVTANNNRIPVEVPDFNINTHIKLGFVCRVIDGEMIIEDYIGGETEIVVPDTIRGYPVVTIGDEAFKDKGLTRVVIPDSIETIGRLALAENELTEVYIEGINVTISDNLMAEDNNKFRQVYLDNNSGGAGRYVGTQEGEWERTNDLVVIFKDNDDSIMLVKGVDVGELVEIPSEPTKIGYTFDKWVTELGGEEEWNFEPPVTESTSLYARWNIVYLERYDRPGTRIAAGFHTAIRKVDDTVWTWGSNEFGQLGDGTTTQRSTPEQIQELTDVVHVSSLLYHIVTIRENGRVWSWGSNDEGRLGDGTTIQRNMPVEALELTGIVYADTGSFHTVALKEDRTVWTWGNNWYGQLGDGTYVVRHSPVQVEGITNIVDVAAGEDHTIALKADGTVWVWGRNHLGQLGDGTGIDSNIPVQVSNLENVVSVMAGHAFTAALKADGTVWAWGSNSNGRLGDGTTTGRNIPVQVLGLTNIVQISSGRRHTLALKDDGTVWAWGWNQDGQLGDGTTTDRNTPVQALGLTNITEVEGGRIHSIALEEDGTIWTWGANADGQLGRSVTDNNNRIPVEVQNFNIKRFTNSDFVFMIIDGEITIEEYIGGEIELEIPGTISGYPVVAIDNEAFMDKGLTGVIIPEEVESIGSNALTGNELTEIFIAGTDVIISDNLMGEGYDNFRLVYTDNISGGTGRYVGTQDGEWERTHNLFAVFRDNDNSIISVKGVNSGSTVEIPSESTRTGYRIAKWVTELGGEEEWNIETPVTENINLYAFWKPTYIVSYEGNRNTSGEVPIDENKYIENESAEALGNTGVLRRSGYRFAGWNTKSDGSGTNYRPGEKINIEGDITLYARWVVEREIIEIEPEEPTEDVNEATVIVDGEEIRTGEKTSTQVEGRTEVKVVVGDGIHRKIEEGIEEISSNRGITIPVNSENADKVKVMLTGDTVKKLDENRFNITVKKESVEYNVPIKSLDINNIAKNFEVDEELLRNIEVEIQISKVDEKFKNKVTQSVRNNGRELMLTPVSFEIKARTTKDNGEIKEINVNRFNTYVERVMQIPLGVEPNQVTTGVVFDKNGGYTHVPTQVFQRDGKWYAKLNSLTNSAYSVVWNPIKLDEIEGHWAEDILNDMASRMIIQDSKNFNPDEQISRGRFAEYLAKALGIYRFDKANEVELSDISTGHAYADGIAALVEYGIMTGYTDRTFRADALITREEAMVLIYKAMLITNLRARGINDISLYLDHKSIEEWALIQAAEVVAAGIFIGRNENVLDPKSIISNAEAITAIRRLLIKSELIDE